MSHISIEERREIVSMKFFIRNQNHKSRRHEKSVRIEEMNAKRVEKQMRIEQRIIAAEEKRHARRERLINESLVHNVVYFIQCDNSDAFIKIGRTESRQCRMQTLQTGCPYKLILLATVPGSNTLEHQLHVRFASSHLHGEWFSPTPELLAYIASLSCQ